jgi:hypothetical protein
VVVVRRDLAGTIEEAMGFVDLDVLGRDAVIGKKL